MFPIAFVVGTAIAFGIGLGFPAALGGGIAGVAIAFGLQFVVGLSIMRRGQAAAPVDLTAEVSEPLSREAYQRMPLAVRNAVVARTVARAADTTPERVAGLLAEMMGRTRMSNLASQRGAQSVVEAVSADRIDTERYKLILEGEVELAAAAAMPPNDRVRAIAERNLGQAVTPDLMRTALLTTRFPLLGRITLAEMMHGAVAGELDLAFVVGSIRKVGEKHQEGLAEL